MRAFKRMAIRQNGDFRSVYPFKRLSFVRGGRSLWVYHLVRSALAAIFVWSGFSKLIDPQSFAIIIEAYGLIPESLILPAAISIPALELLAGIGLFIDVHGSLGTIAGLLIFFAAILGYGIWLGLDADCGCFGGEDPESGAYHGLRPALYRDFLMMAGVTYLYWWRHVRSASPLRLLKDPTTST
jgi:uncharacterized membrane protein YphA (DoxX/SURF4 family)